MHHDQPHTTLAAPTLSRRRAFLATTTPSSGAVTPGAPETRELVLIAEEFDHEIMPGITTRDWGYNGQAAVASSESFTYQFIATPASTRWYHSHADPQLQVPMGLYAPLIVES